MTKYSKTKFIYDETHGYDPHNYVVIMGKQEFVANKITEILLEGKDDICNIQVLASIDKDNDNEIRLVMKYLNGNIAEYYIYDSKFVEKHDIIYYLDWIYDVIIKIFPNFNFNISSNDLEAMYILYNIEYVEEYKDIGGINNFASSKYGIYMNVKDTQGNKTTCYNIYPKHINDYYVIRRSHRLGNFYESIPKCYFRHNECLDELENLEMAKLKKLLKGNLPK